jgi:Subtilase family
MKMKKTLSVLTVLAFSIAGVLGVFVLRSAHVFAQQDSVPGIADSALAQMATIANIKQSFTPRQQKIDATLVFTAKAAAGDLAGTGIDTIPSISGSTLDGYVTVDIAGNVSPAVLAAIAAANGTVITQAATSARASLPLGSLESVAALDDVTSIMSAAQATTNVGALTSQGYVSHAANTAISTTGVNGAGATVGVLSDSASAGCISARIAAGDLPADTVVLPGQEGSGGDEGCAMMEIVHDIAPGAKLMFATAFNGVPSFAGNILALQAAGANVIVDDVTYFNEGAFQDGPIAQAVNQATANGAIYFSSAANSGSLTAGTAGTWEGDFNPNGPAGAPLTGAGTVHNFGTVASPQNFDVVTATSSFVSLKWSDPLGASTNDYDLFILNSAGTAVKGFSAQRQTGTQDPYEFVSQARAVGDRIVVVLFAGNPRALRIDTNRGRLSIATAGSTFGHNAGASTVSMAATYWNSARTGTRPFTGFANPNETFSSDGPRKIFFNPNGSEITPGNFLFATNGGVTLAKPDFAAADGVSCKTPGFLPFFGTSAAAPHAAGIAALVRSARPDYTPAQVLTALKATALDSMAPGVDRDSGSGIVMALPAVQYALSH